MNRVREQLERLNLLQAFISGQAKILDSIFLAEDNGTIHPQAKDNFCKSAITGAIKSMSTESEKIIDWLENREEVKGDVDAAVEDFFSDEEEPEQATSDRHRFTATSAHDNGAAPSITVTTTETFSAPEYSSSFGTEPLSDTVTKEKPCGYTIVGPDNEVRFRDISKTFVRMIRDSDYAQTEQLWVMKEGLFVPGVIGIMKIEDFK